MKRLWRKLRSLGRAPRGVLESRINRLTMTPDGTVRKQAGGVFWRAEHRYDPAVLLQREAAFLAALDGRHVPRLLSSGDGWIEMEHCGAELSADNVPSDWRKQVAEIDAVLTAAGIVHRDIKQGNLLVKDGCLYLIDFGWAIWADETPYLSPRELVDTVPRDLIYNNRAALEWLLSTYSS